MSEAATVPFEALTPERQVKIKMKRAYRIVPTEELSAGLSISRPLLKSGSGREDEWLTIHTSAAAVATAVGPSGKRVVFCLSVCCQQLCSSMSRGNGLQIFCVLCMRVQPFTLGFAVLLPGEAGWEHEREPEVFGLSHQLAAAFAELAPSSLLP